MIHITKKGFQCLEWNSDQHRLVEEEFVSYECLREGVTEVEEGVTLGDIITFTARDEMLRLIVGAYSGCNVGNIYDELKQGVKPLDHDQEVKYCTVAMEVELTNGSKHTPGKKMDVGLEFYGRSGGETSWALDLAPLTEIAALPFRLEANASIHYLDEDKHRVDKDFRYIPTLLELLDAIFFDLSFFGSPEEREAVASTLNERIQSIKNGTAKRVPLDLE